MTGTGWDRRARWGLEWHFVAIAKLRRRLEGGASPPPTNTLEPAADAAAAAAAPGGGGCAVCVPVSTARVRVVRACLYSASCCAGLNVVLLLLLVLVLAARSLSAAPLAQHARGDRLPKPTYSSAQTCVHRQEQLPARHLCSTHTPLALSGPHPLNRQLRRHAR